MKKISLLLATALCVTLFGCGTEKADTVTTGISFEPIESNNESDSLAVADETEEHVTGSLDEEGVYWVSGYLRSSDKDTAGEPDEYGVLQAIIYEATIEDDVLTIKGVTNFRNDKNQDPVGMNDVEEAAFIVTDSTVFQMAGAEDVTKEEFAGYLKDCADTGLLLDIQVNGAQVVVAQICS